MPLRRSAQVLELFLTLILATTSRRLSEPHPHSLLLEDNSGNLYNNNNNKDTTLVTVRFYGEAQCPYCRMFVTKEWQPIWNDPEFRAVIDYDFVPWGNAYFGTKECGLGPRYSSDERHCWAKKCVAATATATSSSTTTTASGTTTNIPLNDDDDEDFDCFSGNAIYQHSEKEGEVDVYESCVKEILGLEAAVAFTYCCEGPNMDDKAIRDARDLMEKCVQPSFEIDGVQKCFEERGKEIEIANAKATPPHPGVPYVVVDGKPLDDPMAVADAICVALATKGMKQPAACAKDSSQQQQQTISHRKETRLLS